MTTSTILLDEVVVVFRRNMRKLFAKDPLVVSSVYFCVFLNEDEGTLSVFL